MSTFSNQDTVRLNQFPHALRVLRCSRTARYFTGEGWSPDASQALVFPDETEAIRACVIHKLNHVELVLRTVSSGTELFSTVIR